MSPIRNTRGAESACYINPLALSKIAQIDLISRTVVEGFVHGLHRSPHLGYSTDFAEHRAYNPGDDIRKIDWKLFGRSDRLYVKKYRGETNTNCYIFMDVSRSMGYGSGAVTKLEYGRYLAASLAYLMTLQVDAVGFVTIDEKVCDFIPPRHRRGHLPMILRRIERLELGGGTGLLRPLSDLAQSISRRGLVVLISDLYDDPADVVKGLRHFRFTGQDVILFHLMDDYELEFPFEAPAQFTDLETNQEIHVVPQALRAEYLKALQEHLQDYKKECSSDRIDYALIRTSQPLDFALYSYLLRRSKHK
ncbi:MAG: DUF58 domain-containing protein [Acidobacteria bacterium]|nr:DUF58 domain-containing protein [Acidobacteriota bacterium]MBI3656305.1 DUF58 domain-containing protein [Acidobacteriota bacterium]